ncbi:hypothetical protein lerEdw1_014923 [Lerista edwardsae]|nr:hypothetical protein lerEdw1_014923 [Lerista edwardsae]
MKTAGRKRARPSCPALKVREAASMYFTLLAVFLVILVAALQGTDRREGDFPYKVPLDPQGLMELSWNVSYRREEVHFQILVKDLRYGLLFGMSDRGGFDHADLAVLWSDGRHSYFADAWTDQDGQLHMDAQQDYKLIRAQKTPEGLYLLFKRSFGTCDPKDYLIEDGTVHLIYGILEAPVPSLHAVNVSALRWKGLQRVQLLKPKISVPEMPSDTMTMEIRAPNVEVPDQETTYWCYITELPDGFAKHHIIKYEPVITKGNEALVHHMEVFQCAAQFDTFPHYSGPCDSKMKPERLNFCRHVLAAWAMGAQAFYYPEEAGLVFGGPSSSRYLRLEVHYHNPLELKGRQDSSGIRLYYTASLRRYDAGIMELGLVYTPVMAIPPGESHFHLTGYCTDKCTQVEIRMLKKVVTVLPGGFGIMEEMCVNYIHYYPQTSLELCKSAVDLGYLHRYFNLVNSFNDEDICTCPETSVTQQFASVPWNSFNRDILKSLYDFAPISMHCNQSTAVRFPGEWEKQPLPTIVEVLRESRPHCERGSDPLPTSPTLVDLDRTAAK